MTQRAACVLSLALAIPLASAEAAGIGPRRGEFRVNSYTPGNQLRPRVAARPNGGFVVVWDSDHEAGPDRPGGYPGSGTRGVFARLFNRNGRPIGGEFLVNAYTTGLQFRPKVAVAPNGEFVVVWTGYGDGGTTPPGGSSYGSGYGVFARQFARDGTPLGGDFQVNTYTTHYQGSPSVAMSQSGDFVVVWHSSYPFDTGPQDGSGYGVFGRQFAASGVPLGDEFQVNTYTPGNQSIPAVAAAANGDFTVVWNSVDGNAIGIFGRRFDADGSPRGDDFRINSYTPGPQSFPTIGAARDGDFVVAWTGQGVPPGQDGSFAGIFAQRFNQRGQRRGAEFLVNTYTTGSQATACLSANPEGDFVVTWRSDAGSPFGSGQDGSSSGVFGQWFDADGGRRGQEFQVNTYTTGSQSAGCPAALPSGDFVVTWQSYLQDGSSSGVFGRRFESPRGRH
jgi:hypothetical protein